MMAVSNSYGTKTLKFDDAVSVLSEKVRRKSSGSAETSESALSVDQRGRQMNRGKKKNDRSKFKSGRGISKSRGDECWQCDEKGHIQRDCKTKKDG